MIVLSATDMYIYVKLKKKRLLGDKNVRSTLRSFYNIHKICNSISEYLSMMLLANLLKVVKRGKEVKCVLQSGSSPAGERYSWPQ